MSLKRTRLPEKNLPRQPRILFFHQMLCLFRFPRAEDRSVYTCDQDRRRIPSSSSPFRTFFIAAVTSASSSVFSLSRKVRL